jgi:nucleoid DNA-binding protein
MAKNGGAPTKSDILNHIAKETGLSRKDASAVLEASFARVSAPAACSHCRVC